jgi:hypothetical protein
MSQRQSVSKYQKNIRKEACRRQDSRRRLMAQCLESVGDACDANPLKEGSHAAP